MAEGQNAHAEADRETIRDAFEAWQQGIGAITDVFASDMVWRIEGRSLVSREYRGKQQFIDEVLAPFGARFPYAWVMRLRDGKVVDGAAFYDSISFNDLWTPVQPRS